MARYTGAVCRLCRREGMKLFLKGTRCFTDKCAIEKRAYPPGQHGKRRVKIVGYGHQLREKHAGCGSDREGDLAKAKDAERLGAQELVRGELAAHREPEQDRHDIDHLVLGGTGKAIDDPGFIQQIAEHEGANERRRVGLGFLAR